MHERRTGLGFGDFTLKLAPHGRVNSEVALRRQEEVMPSQVIGRDAHVTGVVGSTVTL
jgi:hypothetical protein